MKLVRQRLPCLDITALPIGVVIVNQGDSILIIRWTLVEGLDQEQDSFSIFKAHETIERYTWVLQTWARMCHWISLRSIVDTV